MEAISYPPHLAHLDCTSRPNPGSRSTLLAQLLDRLEPGPSLLNTPGSSRPMRKLHSSTSAKYRMIKSRNVRYRLRQRGIVSSPASLCCKRTGREDPQNIEVAASVNRVSKGTMARIAPSPALHTRNRRADSTTCSSIQNCAQAINRVIKCRLYDGGRIKNRSARLFASGKASLLPISSFSFGDCSILDSSIVVRHNRRGHLV
jgi:hypothetical protein